MSLTVDDTFDDAQLEAEDFEAHGMKVSFFVNTPRFDLGASHGYMTLDQVLDLQKKGHEIGGHTLDHPHLSGMTDDQQHTEICHDRAALLAAGFDIKNFAYPFGDYGKNGGLDARQTVRDCGYNTARSIGGISESVAAPNFSESFSPADIWAIQTPSSVGASTTLKTMQAYVTNAVKVGGWIIVNMHHVCSSDPRFTATSCISTNSIKQEDLVAFLDWLQPLVAPGQSLQMQTIRQMVWAPTQPPVVWNAAVPPAGTNLLPNPSLELYYDFAYSGGAPDCWELPPAGHGNNGGPPDGGPSLIPGEPHTGDAGVEVVVGQYISGTRGLMTKRGWQSCSPVLDSTKHYLMSAWYVAPTNTPQFELDYLNPATNSWFTWAMSSRFAYSASYAQAVWAIDSLPPGAQVVSVGMVLSALGDLTVDDFSLVEEEP